MSRQTKFFCDNCKKEIGQPYGPLTITIEAIEFVIPGWKADLCSADCTHAWLKRVLEKM